MAHYLVTARPKRGLLAELEARLGRAEFVDLRPFGHALSLSLNGARLLRKSPAGTHEIPIRLQEMLRAKAEDMAMQSEDILFIPGSRGKYAARSTFSTILTIATGVAIRGY